MKKKMNFKLKLLLGFLTYGLVLTSIVIFTIYEINKKNIHNVIIQNASFEFQKKEKIFLNHINEIKAKLFSIENSKFFKDYLDGKIPKENINQLFFDISNASKDTMNIRFINNEGKEEIRVNKNKDTNKSYIVEDKNLQLKSNRYYFKEITQLAKNKIWYSKIDLNMEKGKIEFPIRPVLRVGIPIFHKNKRKGLLIINIFMDQFIKELTTSSSYNIFLIDKDGYFIHHTNPDYSWSKYLNTGFNLKNEFPNDSEIILKNHTVKNNSLYSKKIQLKNNEIKIIVIPKEYKIEKQISENREKLYFVVIGVLILSIPFAYLFALTPAKLKEDVDKLNKTLEEKVHKKTKELQDLNNNLEKKVKDELEKNIKKDELLYQQSKMAAMGEMLGNIAHQWRQPLSAISISASGIKMQNELGILTDEDINKYCSNIIRNTEYLSKTIDDFRNFFNPNKDFESFNVKKALENNITIMESNLKNNHVELILDLNENIEVFSLKNELTQVNLNIINNSKDALLLEKNKDLRQKLIFLKLEKSETEAIISIYDNAGGIAPEIISKIFDPYFTTKHQSQGTGIGLYMSREIVVKHLNGTIEVSNVNYKYNEKTYKGAMFKIKLPLK